MKQSRLFPETIKETPKDEVSVNASLLIRAGFIDKVSAGIYTYLPLGLRVLHNIQTIIREEMDAISAQELLMPALHPKELWEKTGRWNDPGAEVMFQFEARGREYGLGWTHEEVVTSLAKKYIHSYKDLPLALYQIQDKFRNKARAKSGILRGREFNMKDLYSFHASEADLERYYEQAMEAYHRIFERVGLAALVVEASGGAFAPYSHEYQVATPHGEDIIYTCYQCNRHQNKEIVKDAACPDCGKERKQEKAIEVGNIFKLGTRFSSAFSFTFIDEAGKRAPVLMGCYGIGPSRVMGAIAEVHNDQQGLVWPQSIAPFSVHLLQLGTEVEVAEQSLVWYDKLTHAGISVLWDDRDMRAGEKFADSDLIGIPHRLVISKKTGEQAELKARHAKDTELLTLAEGVARLSHAR